MPRIALAVDDERGDVEVAKLAPGLLAAGLMGAFLLSASDVIAQRLLDADLPVGVVTGALGGVYLGWLLYTGRSRT